MWGRQLLLFSKDEDMTMRMCWKPYFISNKLMFSDVLSFFAAVGLLMDYSCFFVFFSPWVIIWGYGVWPLSIFLLMSHGMSCQRYTYSHSEKHRKRIQNKLFKMWFIHSSKYSCLCTKIYVTSFRTDGVDYVCFAYLLAQCPPVVVVYRHTYLVCRITKNNQLGKSKFVCKDDIRHENILPYAHQKIIKSRYETLFIISSKEFKGLFILLT